MSLERIAFELKETGRSIYPRFIAPELSESLRVDLRRLQSAGEFRAAGTGKGHGYQPHNTARRDEIRWLEESSANSVQVALFERMERLKEVLNRTLFLGLSKFEGHYAVYSPEGYYQRHLDSFRQDDARVVSTILYLNESWSVGDGGRLRLYENESYTDIDPLDGTLICFLSREQEHEVLPSHANRISFAGWFKTREWSGPHWPSP